MFLELSFRILTGLKIGNISFLYVFLYNIFVSLLISFIVTWGNKVFNKVLYYVSIFLISFIYALQLCVYKMFGFYFDWSLLGATDQVASFAGDGLKLILENLLGVIVLFLPFILLLIFIKRVIINKSEIKVNIIKLIGLVIVYLVFIGSLYINSKGINSAKELYFDVNNNELNIGKFGVLKAIEYMKRK